MEELNVSLINENIESINKSISELKNMIYDQSVAINNLIMAYNQDVIQRNAVSNNSNSILKKLADVEIKIDNNDDNPIDEISSSMNNIFLELSQIKGQMEQFNIYGGYNNW